jgi:hypothetical protein
MPLLTGCDVSVFQPLALVDWSRQDFGIVRATYGKSPDKSTTGHVERIRKAGKRVGLYHFFRADQDVEAQYNSFMDRCEACSIVSGDIVPAVDVEDFPSHKIGPGDVGALEAFCSLLCAQFDCKPLIYITQRDWHRLGKPAWILGHPLWVAHYPGYGATSPLAKPATPNGAPWRIWQCLVGPLDRRIQKHDDPKAVDQNFAADPLPTIAAHADEPPATLPGSAIPYVHLTDEAWEEMTAARDRRIREDSDK